jgi:hypothetical protein
VDHPILIYAFCLPLIQIEMVPDVLLDWGPRKHIHIVDTSWTCIGTEYAPRFDLAKCAHVKAATFATHKLVIVMAMRQVVDFTNLREMIKCHRLYLEGALLIDWLGSKDISLLLSR